MPLGVDTGGRRPPGGDEIEHPVAAGAARLDVADGWGLRLAECREQRRHLREHLLVDTECHGCDSNVDVRGVDRNRAATGSEIARFAPEVVAPIAIGVVAVLHCAAGAFGGSP